MSKKGFTLIELLVVVTIIGILGGVGLTSFQGAQGKARDAKRKQDLQSIGVALEVYAQGNNLKYIQGASPIHSCTDTSDTNALYTNIASYMANGNVPKDPQTQAQYCYYALNNGQSFRLFTKLENCNQSGPNFLCQFQTWNYSVYSSDLLLAGTSGDATFDADGDTYQAGTPGTTCANGKLCDCYDASGGSTAFCDTGTHTTSYCARPGQTGWFSTTRGTSSQGNDFAGNTWNSFDYNCDNITTKLRTTLTDLPAPACYSSQPATHTEGYTADTACGAFGTFKGCVVYTLNGCTGSGCSGGIGQCSYPVGATNGCGSIVASYNITSTNLQQSCR